MSTVDITWHRGARSMQLSCDPAQAAPAALPRSQLSPAGAGQIRGTGHISLQQISCLQHCGPPHPGQWRPLSPGCAARPPACCCVRSAWTPAPPARCAPDTASGGPLSHAPACRVHKHVHFCTGPHSLLRSCLSCPLCCQPIARRKPTLLLCKDCLWSTENSRLAGGSPHMVLPCLAPALPAAERGLVPAAPLCRLASLRYVPCPLPNSFC